MPRYINKSALVAEIEKVIDEPAPSHDQQCPWEDGYYCGLYKAESIIDDIEVKEVDLDKELDYDDYITFFNDHPGYSNGYWGFDETWAFGQYCYKLGLKAQQG